MSSVSIAFPPARPFLRGREPKPRTTPLARWLTAARQARGLSMRSLAAQADVSQARISQIEDGGTTKRDTVERIARALVPADLPEAEAADAYRRLLKDGLKAAGFAGDAGDALDTIIEEIGYDAQEFTDEEKARMKDDFNALVVGIVERERRNRKK